MPTSRLWLLNSDGKLYTLSTASRHLQDVIGKVHGRSTEFKRISALSQCSWALGSDHHLYVYIPSSDIPLRVQEVTYENERWTPGVGWTGRSIVPNARKHWTDINGQGYFPKENFELPSSNWEWEGDWQVDENIGGEVSGLVGWHYAANWIGKFSAEMTWKSYVRRRKWVRYRRYTCCDAWARVSTLGDEMGDPAELFLDVSVGGQDLSCQVEGRLCVWTVSITGQVYIRLGVSGECPEGHTWRHVPVGQPGDSGVIQVSVGATGQAWVVTWDGQALVRTNISPETPYGTDWVKVPAPLSSPILQVSVGRQTVWAISREGKIWFWKCSGEVYEGSWVEMVGHMSLVSVSQNDQVFGIGLDDEFVHIRTSVTPELLTGKTWEPLKIQEPIKAECEDGYGSSVSVSLQSSSRSFQVSSSQRSSQGSFSTSYQSMTSQKCNNVKTAHSIQSKPVNVTKTVHVSPYTSPCSSEVFNNDKVSTLHQSTQSEPTNDKISKTQCGESFSLSSQEVNISVSESVDQFTPQVDGNMTSRNSIVDKTRTAENQKLDKSDTLVSIDKCNTVVSGEKSDTVVSDEKSDIVVSDETSDTVVSDDKSDTVVSDDKSDTVVSDEKSDTVVSDDKSDTVVSDEKSDTVVSDEKSDTVVSDEKSDTVVSDDKSDTVVSDEKSDTVVSDDKSDTVVSDEKSDTVVSDEKSDTVVSDEKSDTVVSDEKSDTVSGDEEVENHVSKRKPVILQGSMELDSLTSNSSECADFVTDLLSPNEKQQFYTKTQSDDVCNFVTDLLEGKCRKGGDADMSDFREYKVGEADSCKEGVELREANLVPMEREEGSRIRDENETDKDEIDFTLNEIMNTVTRPVAESSSAVSFISEPGQEDVTDSETEHSDSVTGVNMNWIWISATACHVEDTAALPWLQSNTKITADAEPPIDAGLRQSLLQQLLRRNKQVDKFANYEEAVEKSVWVKRGHLELKLNSKRESEWIKCELELEQGLHGNTSQTGLLFLHFSQNGKQMHIQLSLAGIVCVTRITVSNFKSAFAIFLTEDVQAKRKSYILSAASEKETDDWVASISIACSSLRGETQALEQALCWAVTDRGDVFVHQPSTHTLQLSHMYWQQVGGHMLMVKSNTGGITWAISHDHTAYVYTGGYGGGLFKGISSVCRDVHPQIDVRQMYIYENQKWNLLTGFSTRFHLANKYSWTDESGKVPMTQQSIQTPSTAWHWVSEWAVDYSTPGGVDPDGWQYSTTSNRTQDFHIQQGWRDSYRRRRWVRRCKLTTSGPWLPVGPLPIIDVTIQPEESSNNKTAFVWAVGANRDALCRMGVTPSKPQGDAWVHVPADQPFLAISIGGNNWVWAIAPDGSVWFRSGVSVDLPTGKVWLQVVPSPPGGAPLQQISVGDNSVWAVDIDETLWRRKDTSVIYPEGTEWEFVSKQVQYVSAGEGDEVWVVRHDVSRKAHVKGVLSRRLGISADRPLGTGWQDGIGGLWSQVSVRGLKKTDAGNDEN